MRKIIFLDQLGEKFLRKAMNNHFKRIVADGIYTNEEIEYYVNDLGNQKIVDLEDALDNEVYEILRSEQKRLNGKSQ